MGNLITKPQSLIKPISVSVKDAVKLTGLGERTIWSLIKSGEIKSDKVAGRRIIFYDELENFMRGN